MHTKKPQPRNCPVILSPHLCCNHHTFREWCGRKWLLHWKYIHKRMNWHIGELSELLISAQWKMPRQTGGFTFPLTVLRGERIPVSSPNLTNGLAQKAAADWWRNTIVRWRMLPPLCCTWAQSHPHSATQRTNTTTGDWGGSPPMDQTIPLRIRGRTAEGAWKHFLNPGC